MTQLEISAPPKDVSKVKAFLKLVLALFSISFAPIFIRFSEVELGAYGTVFNRLWIFVIAFGLTKFLRHSLTVSAANTKEEKGENERELSSLFEKNNLLLVGVGVASITSLALWAVALQYTSVANCMLLNNLTPIFTSLGAFLCFGKRFDLKFIVGMLIALLGAVLLCFGDLGGSSGHLRGDLYSLLSAVFLGIYFLIVEQLRSKFSATTILLWRGSIGGLLLIPVIILAKDSFFPHLWTTWLAVIGLGLISEGLGQRLLADSMKQFSASFIAIFLLLEPLISAILAWIIFAEALSSGTWGGFALILGGIYLAQTSQASTQGENN
ncbi:MAG: DMT family transporter [Microcystaceae cyanobacterium]